MSCSKHCPKSPVVELFQAAQGWRPPGLPNEVETTASVKLDAGFYRVSVLVPMPDRGDILVSLRVDFELAAATAGPLGWSLENRFTEALAWRLVHDAWEGR